MQQIHACQATFIISIVKLFINKIKYKMSQRHNSPEE